MENQYSEEKNVETGAEAAENTAEAAEIAETTETAETDETAAQDGQAASEPDKTGAKEPFDLAREICEWLEVAVTALTAVLLIFTFLGRVATVDGTSMLPTLTHGEKLIVQEVAYEPRQGDIVICQSAVWGLENPLVKRVIALEGQTVTVNFVLTPL